MLNENYYEINDGELRVWIEQSALICIKSVTECGDPVELTGDQAEELAEYLLKFAKKIK